MKVTVLRSDPGVTTELCVTPAKAQVSLGESSTGRARPGMCVLGLVCLPSPPLALATRITIGRAFRWGYCVVNDLILAWTHTQRHRERKKERDREIRTHR